MVGTGERRIATPKDSGERGTFSMKGNSMKRVKYLAAAAGVAPVTVGLAVTVPAAAGTANHAVTHKPASKKVRTSGKVCDRDVCIQVFGSGNDVSKVTEWITNPTRRPDTFQAWASLPNGASGLWKQTYGGSWVGTKSHTWHPACSWPGLTDKTRTLVTGRATRAVGVPGVSVHGSNYSGQHECGFI